MPLTITLVGATEARARLSAFSERLAAGGLLTAVTSAALIVQTDAAVRAPGKSGNLRRSLHTQTIESTRTLAIVAVGTDVSYARPVEFGTRAHTIYPRTAKALWWRGAKHPVAKVNHPGTRAQPYLIPALTQNLGRIKDEIVAALAALFGSP